MIASTMSGSYIHNHLPQYKSSLHIGQTCHHHIIIPTYNLDGNIVSCLHVSSSDTHKILSKSSATHNMLASTKIDQNKLTSHPAGHSQGHCSSYQWSPSTRSSCENAWSRNLFVFSIHSWEGGCPRDQPLYIHSRFAITLVLC